MANDKQLSLASIPREEMDLVIIGPTEPEPIARFTRECQEMGVPYVYSVPLGDSDDFDAIKRCRGFFTSNPAPTAFAAVQAVSGVSFERINWQLKAILPIAIVLLNGLLLFMLATVSWRDTERHSAV